MGHVFRIGSSALISGLSIALAWNSTMPWASVLWILAGIIWATVTWMAIEILRLDRAMRRFRSRLENLHE